MPADRHDDRRKAAQTTEQALAEPRHHHVREQVKQSVATIRAQVLRGGPGAGSGGSIDAHMDRIVSEQANHTEDAPGRASDGDGRTNDHLRAVLETHRREMELAGVTAQAMAARNATRSHGNPDAAPTVDRPVCAEELPPRQAALRDPRDPRSPGRPSITTMSQKHSYGPQNFSRTDVIDRPKSLPTFAAGGNAPNPPTPPGPAAGYAASLDQKRSGPSRSI
jgi:hypothetical protein